MPIFPIDIVRQFLNAMEARDIVKAKEMLAHDFEMTFPGGAVFHELEQLIDWSKSRYKSIGKTFEKFDNMSNESLRQLIVKRYMKSGFNNCRIQPLKMMYSDKPL